MVRFISLQISSGQGAHNFIPQFGHYLPLFCQWWGGDLYRYLYGETGKHHANLGPTIHPCRLSQYVSMFSANKMDLKKDCFSEEIKLLSGRFAENRKKQNFIYQ
jgi:hypothetical protein